MTARSPGLTIVGVALAIGCARAEPEPPALEGATLVFPSFDSLTVPLEGSEGEVANDDGTITLQAGLTEWRIVQDLDGDGAVEALAVVWSSGGGSGTFFDLTLLESSNGWVWLASASLGDRIDVRAMALWEEEVSLHLIVHGDEDPMCCPTERVERRFRFVDDELEEVAEDRGGASE